MRPQRRRDCGYFFVLNERWAETVLPPSLILTFDGESAVSRQDRERQNSEALSEITSRMAGGVRKNVQAVNTSARILLQLKIDNLEPTNFAKLADNFEGITGGEIIERLNTAYPKADELMILAIGPDSECFPDACVVKDLSEALACE